MGCNNLSSSILIILLSSLLVHGLPVSQELYEGDHCILENNKTGVCKSIYECPPKLQEVIEGKRFSDSKERCGFENFTEIVCCQVNVTRKIALRPADIACQQYENEIKSEVQYNIFGGVEAQNREFPYMVALGFRNTDDNESDEENGEDIEYNCGGTLISSQHVLTAAHCVNNVQEKEPVEVMIGSVDVRNKGNEVQRIAVSNVKSHPRFNRNANYNDVAILKLATPVTMASNVRPICIQTKSLESIDMSKKKNSSFVVIGWGATSFNFEDLRSAKLRKTPSLSMVDKQSCNASYISDFAKLPHGLDESMLCFRDTNTSRKADACHGDSGGPLLMVSGLDHRIVGVTAFGQTCGGNIPGIYTEVYSFLDWIESQVWPEMVDKR